MCDVHAFVSFPTWYQNQLLLWMTCSIWRLQIFFWLVMSIPFLFYFSILNPSKSFHIILVGIHHVPSFFRWLCKWHAWNDIVLGSLVSFDKEEKKDTWLTPDLMWLLQEILCWSCHSFSIASMTSDCGLLCLHKEELFFFYCSVSDAIFFVGVM